MAIDSGEKLRLLIEELRRRWGYEGSRQLSAFARRLNTRHSTILSWMNTGKIAKSGRRILSTATDTSDEKLLSYLKGEITLQTLLDDEAGDAAIPVSQQLRQIRTLLGLITPDEIFLLLIDIGNRLKNLPLKQIETTSEPNTIQQVILQELAKQNRPWSGSTAPLSVFADEVLLDLNELLAILGGRRPESGELDRLSQILTRDESAQLPWNLEDLTNLVKQQYGKKRKPSDET